MPIPESATDIAKFAAAQRACDFVEDGMRVGLGTGSTAAWLVRCLGRKVAEEGLRITGVPTSRRTADLARAAGIPVTSLDEAGWLDLTIDGADEFDAAFALVKGGGGALLREKIVATASDRMVVIAGADKEVETLGAFPLPVEVIPFGAGATRRHVAATLAGADLDGREIALRTEGEEPFVTDEGHHIFDLHLRRIGDAQSLAAALTAIPGVVETGLFIGICDTVVIGAGDGEVRLRDRRSGTETRDRIDPGLARDLP